MLAILAGEKHAETIVSQTSWLATVEAFIRAPLMQAKPQNRPKKASEWRNGLDSSMIHLDSTYLIFVIYHIIYIFYICLYILYIIFYMLNSSISLVVAFRLASSYSSSGFHDWYRLNHSAKSARVPALHSEIDCVDWWNHCTYVEYVARLRYSTSSFFNSSDESFK